MRTSPPSAACANEIGTVEMVPGRVVNSFRASAALQRIKGDVPLKYSEYLYNTITGTQFYPDCAVKKEEISKLQNGKAGNVYIISNLGSFGENVFKIGMTRRMDPQERVDELGSASVPFKFDVHSFIFSDDAVALENKLHSILNEKRVNKVNMRKEFFHATIDELEELVNKLDPTAEFNKTMLAEEFRQSQSVDVPYTSDISDDSDDDE